MDDMRSTDIAMSRQLSQFLDTGSGDSAGTPEDDTSSGEPLEEDIEDVPEELTLVCAIFMLISAKHAGDPWLPRLFGRK